MNFLTRLLDPGLTTHPFLEGISLRHLELIAGFASEVSFSQNQYLFHEYEEARDFYLILSGRISVETFADGYGPLTIQIVRNGEILGWSSLVPPHHWRFNAKAILPSHALALDGKLLREQCERDHDFGYEIFKRLGHITAQRVELTRQQLVSTCEILSSK